VQVDCAVNPTDYLGHFWVDTLVHDIHAFRLLMDKMGEDKICLGSDYPFPLGEHRPGELIESLNIANEIKEKLLYKNAIEWLGLSETGLGNL
jgi:aminocarboxymuconate-semialdehyde decarboxylase